MKTRFALLLAASSQWTISSRRFLHVTCHPSSSFFPPSLIIATYSLKTPAVGPSLLFFPFRELNSSPLAGPFTGKRSERILEFHQLPSPLDMSLMNCRAHTKHNGRGEDAETYTDKMRKRESWEREVRVEGRGEEGLKKISFSLRWPKRCDLSHHHHTLHFPVLWYRVYDCPMATIQRGKC